MDVEQDHGSARTLFTVPLRSEMGVADSDSLRDEAGMTLHLERKHPAVVPPLGFAPLDDDSALFLEPGPDPVAGCSWLAPGAIRLPASSRTGAVAFSTWRT